MKIRRDSIKAINKTNEFISDRLLKAQCYVPSKETLDKHAIRAEKFKRFASVRRENGQHKLDPLIHKRKNFVIATPSSMCALRVFFISILFFTDFRS